MGEAGWGGRWVRGMGGCRAALTRPHGSSRLHPAVLIGPHWGRVEDDTHALIGPHGLGRPDRAALTRCAMLVGPR